MSQDRDRSPRSLQAALEINITVVGILFLAAALLANENWWDRHFLPLFFFAPEKYLLSERLARLAMAVLGLGVIFHQGSSQYMQLKDQMKEHHYLSMLIATQQSELVALRSEIQSVVHERKGHP